MRASRGTVVGVAILLLALGFIWSRGGPETPPAIVRDPLVGVPLASRETPGTVIHPTIPPVAGPEPVSSGTSPRIAAAVLVVHAIDGEGGPAAVGAEIRVVASGGAPRVLRTDGSGIARFEAVPPGHAGIRASMDGRVRVDASEELEAGRESSCDVVLERGAAVSGTVLDGATGRPIPGARIVVVPGGGLDPWSQPRAGSDFEAVIADAEGRFLLAGVPRKEIVTLCVSARRHSARRESLQIEGDSSDTNGRIIRLRPAGAIRGRVTLPTGGPAAGATVIAVPADHLEELLEDIEKIRLDNQGAERPLRARSADDGGFEIDGVDTREGLVLVASLEGAGRSAPSSTVRLADSAPEAVVDLALRKGASLSVHLVAPAGRSIEGASVHLYSGRSSVELFARGRGRFSANELPGGARTLRVRTPGYPSVERTVDIAEGSDLEIEIPLDAGVGIEGVVVDDLGSPVSGEEVWIHLEHWSWWDPESRSRTDEAGRFRAGGLTPGEYVAEVSGHVLKKEFRLVVPGTGARIVAARPGSVAFRLRVPPGREPPQGMRVLRGSTSSPVEWNDGVLRFATIPPGPFHIRVEAEGYAALELEGVVHPGTESNLGEVALEPGIVLSGRILTAGGATVAGARIACETEASFHAREVIADREGRFLLDGLPGGTAKVTVEAKGYMELRVEFELVSGAPPVRWVLRQCGLVRGRVLAADGTALTGARVTLTRPGRLDEEDFYWPYYLGDGGTDFEGRFEVYVEAGSFSASVNDFSGSTRVSASGVVDEGEVTEIDIRVPAR